ncbi:MAG: response regulator [Pseudomonadota bacterium]
MIVDTQIPEPQAFSRKLQLKLIAGIVIVNLLVFCLAGISLYQSWEQFHQRAAIEARNHLQILDRDIVSALDRIDFAFLSVSDQFEQQDKDGRADQAELSKTIARIFARQPDLEAVRIADAQGQVVLGSGKLSTPAFSIADREYFQVLRDDPKAGLVVTKPLKGKVGGKWGVILARRLNRQDGSFGGIVYVGFLLERLQQISSSLGTGEHGVISIYDRDLGLIVRQEKHAAAKTDIGSRADASYLAQQLSRQPGQGDFFRHGEDQGGQESLHAYRKLARYPFYLQLETRTDDYLADWYSQARWTMVLVFAFFAVTVLFCWMVSRLWIQREGVMRDLRLAKTLADSASRAKSEFVANMSHEIRTPMNAVLGMTHLLGNTPLSAVQRKYLDMIDASGQSLMIILNDILDFSKIEAGRLELSLARFDLGDVLNMLATIMTVNAGEKDLELAIGTEPGVPRVVIGDAPRLQQILINLVGNAVKFTHKGEVSLLAQKVAEQGDAVTLRFCIRDTGIGMSPGQQERLFSAFTQADTSTTRLYGGTGLGLAISRRLLDLMGGTIQVHSELGKGSEFIVTVPFQLAAATATDDAAGKLAAAKPGLRLLVVDDNATSRDYLCKTIYSWGWQVDSVASGAQALEQITENQAAGQYYDVVLADWQMPDMDGLATMQAIRQALPAARMPVVVMVSAFGRDGLTRTAAAADADAILIKPVTSSSLYDTVHEVLANKSGLGKKSARQVAPATNGGKLEGARLLLVEDNNLNQVVAKAMLEQEGASVHIAEDGQQAVDFLRASAFDVDLVLMDVQMPVMDGFSATRMIRDELKLSLPILAMTAGVMESERERCAASGMDDFIAKPLDPEKMFATICKHLPVRSLHRPLTATFTTSVDANMEPEDVDENQQRDQVSYLDQLYEMVKNNAVHRTQMLDVMSRISEHGPNSLDQAHLAWLEGRRDDVMRIFHAMRGSVGTLGNFRFVDAALELEAAIRGQQNEQVNRLFATVEKELDMTISTARAWLEKHSGNLR